MRPYKNWLRNFAPQKKPGPGMAEVLGQELRRLVKSLLDLFGRSRITPAQALGEAQLHRCLRALVLTPRLVP